MRASPRDLPESQLPFQIPFQQTEWFIEIPDGHPLSVRFLFHSADSASQIGNGGAMNQGRTVPRDW